MTEDEKLEVAARACTDTALVVIVVAARVWWGFIEDFVAGVVHAYVRPAGDDVRERSRRQFTLAQIDSIAEVEPEVAWMVEDVSELEAVGHRLRAEAAALGKLTLAERLVKGRA